VRFLATLPYRTLLIEAPAFVDARAYAERVLGKEKLLCTQTGDDAGCDVELRWVGSDAGTKPDKRLQIKVTGGEWTDDKP
jgi:hypothetical protein